ncbi:SAM-dependent methyltransferase [Thermocatellispora tengchongensis]|uniref:SAM-dependent methyltransferase n=1 Tax=Thermocatellispora tengchongensis TaxID=1073253 RepID=A0A840NZ35_9ACTN|nr:methyltransferase [Thermocatellispora tengchongensis]MBB5132029.1 SAM-dependent methyltransferase [Thermocatellispora tengchongensis]
MPLDLPPDEAADLRAGRAPGAHLDLVHAMVFRAAVAGLRLGLFRALEDGPREPGELARELGADPFALGVLLRALESGGYVAEGPGGYARTPAGEWLSGPESGYGAVLDFWHEALGELWRNLEDTVRDGGPRRDFYTWLEARPALLARFQRMQRDLAVWLGEEVVALAGPPEGAARLLDLGGGHAAYSIAYCRRHPGLAATVLDLPAALGPGRAAAAAEGLAGRVAFLPGDLRIDEPPGGQDAVLLFNVLHGFPATVARAVVERAARALRPGGRLLVLETRADPCGGVRDTAFTRGFELNLVHTQGGRLHPVELLCEWLAGAGCAAPARYDLTRSATHVLLAADRAG